MAKLVSRRLKAQPIAAPHPDPESLAAFAENVLPDRDRGQLLHHLEACSDCREILYLALPDVPETQKVLALQPRPFRRWALGWGALVASVAIAAIFFTSNRLAHKNQTAPMVASAPAVATETETKIAADKTPLELDQMRAGRDASASKMAVAQQRSEAKPQLQAKHMTGKMKPELVFEDSGEVRVQGREKSANAPATPASKDERQKLSSPTTGANNEVVARTGSAGKLRSSGHSTTAPSQSRADQREVAGQQAAGQADALSESNSAQAEVRNEPAKVPEAVEARNAGNDGAAFHGNVVLNGSPPPAPGPVRDKNAVSSTLSLAQGPTASGNLGGVVSDPSGAAVGNARITMIGPTGTKAITSDPEGRFSFDRLTPGIYSIKAEANGFKSTEIKQLAVLDKKSPDLQVRLEVGSSSEVVEVASAAPVVDTSSGFIAGRQTAELSMQKSAAHVRRQEIGRGAGSGAASTLHWTVSPEGAVQRSADSGKTWRAVSVAPGVTFRALSAIGANIWAGGKAGALYHSTDSGQTWAKVEPAVGSKKLDQEIVRVDFSDALSGAVNTANGEVWTTSDAGQTWQRK